MNEQLQREILEALPQLTLRMVYKFGVHAGKGPWTKVEIREALVHLEDEVHELRKALVCDSSYEDIADECADVANMALIIQHNYKRGARYVREGA